MRSVDIKMLSVTSYTMKRLLPSEMFRHSMKAIGGSNFVSIGGDTKPCTSQHNRAMRVRGQRLRFLFVLLSPG